MLKITAEAEGVEATKLESAHRSREDGYPFFKSKKMRKLVVGDIHGGYKALLQILERANVTPEDRLIFLGDYVDGWSQSAEVVEKMLELSETNECVFIRGNHDKWCQDWLETGNQLTQWVMQGGQATIDSYIRTGNVANEKHKEFFRNMATYYIDEDNNGFVHGGYTMRKGLGHEAYAAEYYWDRSLWQNNALCGSLEQMPKILEAHKEIFIGHTSTVIWGKDTPMKSCNVWNLDTGGGWNGKVTIMDVETKEYWQSDTVKELYPDEKGR